jgi:RNA polymerase primary sigma factor
MGRLRPRASGGESLIDSVCQNGSLNWSAPLTPYLTASILRGSFYFGASNSSTQRMVKSKGRKQLSIKPDKHDSKKRVKATVKPAPAKAVSAKTPPAKTVPPKAAPPIKAPVAKAGPAKAAPAKVPAGKSAKPSATQGAGAHPKGAAPAAGPTTAPQVTVQGKTTPELTEKIKELLRLAQEQGYLTYSDINEPGDRNR